MIDKPQSADPSESAGQRLYRIYGLELGSDLPFEARLPAGRLAADLSVEESPSPPLADSAWRTASPSFTSPRRTAEGDSAALLYELDGWEVLRFSGFADYYLSYPAGSGKEPARIVIHRTGDASDLEMETRLLGPVLAYWLERRGILAFHASAVVVDGGALLFLSDNGGGKSTLAAAALRAGHGLLSDDLVPVGSVEGEFRARPSYPEMRLWPADADHFLGGSRSLSRVDPRFDKRRVPIGGSGLGRFHASQARLAGLVVPRLKAEDRSGGTVDLRRLSPAVALIELVRHSYSPYIVEGVGLQPQRLALFSQIIASTPVWQLEYPPGYDLLDGVLEVLLRGLER